MLKAHKLQPKNVLLLSMTVQQVIVCLLLLSSTQNLPLGRHMQQEKSTHKVCLHCSGSVASA